MAVCCIQETRYRGGNCRIIKGKDTKLYWSGNDEGTAGVGVFVAEEWTEKVFEVQRVSDRIIFVKLVVGQRVVTFYNQLDYLKIVAEHRTWDGCYLNMPN